MAGVGRFIDYIRGILVKLGLRTEEEELPAPLLYYRILVAGDGEQQITFDNNANSNYWSFHHGSISPNVSELFHMEFVGEKVRILGYLVPRTRFGQVIWYLTISDDRRSIPDRYPRFVAINEESEGFTSEFTYYDDPNQPGYFGLSFQNKRMKRWYLVPDYHRRRIGISDTAEYPFTLLRPNSQYYSYCSGRT